MPVETEVIVRHLEEKEKKEGKLPPLLKFYQKLLRVQSEVERKLASQSKVSLSREAINKQLERGLPLIDLVEPALDRQLLIDTFSQVTAIFGEHSELFRTSPEKLKEIKATPLLAREITGAWLREHKLPSTMLKHVADENLLAAVIQATLKPFLVGQAKTLINFVDQELWRRGFCPICGGIPDLAYLDKERGSRWLVCSGCDTEWVFPRLQCPYCGTQDQNALAYFTDDKGLYRLYVCEQCKHYLKAIDLRQAEAEVLFPLERFYTVDMDRQAQEQGYRPSPVRN